MAIHTNQTATWSTTHIPFKIEQCPNQSTFSRQAESCSSIFLSFHMFLIYNACSDNCDSQDSVLRLRQSKLWANRELDCARAINATLNINILTPWLVVLAMHHSWWRSRRSIFYKRVLISENRQFFFRQRNKTRSAKAQRTPGFPRHDMTHTYI